MTRSTRRRQIIPLRARKKPRDSTGPHCPGKGEPAGTKTPRWNGHGWLNCPREPQFGWLAQHNEAPRLGCAIHDGTPFLAYATDPTSNVLWIATNLVSKYWNPWIFENGTTEGVGTNRRSRIRSQ